MPHVFDPYYDWLGISPEEQPANYYRLLGVKLFEQRETVISNAADQRMAFLRTLQQGAHSKESQKLLNEVAQARVTLLNPERKRVYDEELHKQLNSQLKRKSKETPPPVPRQSVVKYPTTSMGRSESETQVFIPIDEDMSLQNTAEFSPQTITATHGFRTNIATSKQSRDKKRSTNKVENVHKYVQLFCFVSVLLVVVLGIALIVKVNGKAGKSAQAQQQLFHTKEGTSPVHQPGERIAKTIRGVEFAFRWCPPGEFEMGSPDSEEGRDSRYEIQHKVLIKKGFWMMETPVTQAQWKAFMGANPSCFLGNSQPVEQVSFSDCQTFCDKGVEFGLSLAIPSEAQWEYACRAGTTTRYNYGDSADEFYKHGNYCDVRCDANQKESQCTRQIAR